MGGNIKRIIARKPDTNTTRQIPYIMYGHIAVYLRVNMPDCIFAVEWPTVGQSYYTSFPVSVRFSMLGNLHSNAHDNCFYRCCKICDFSVQGDLVYRPEVMGEGNVQKLY